MTENTAHVEVRDPQLALETENTAHVEVRDPQLALETEDILKSATLSAGIEVRVK